MKRNKWYNIEDTFVNRKQVHFNNRDLAKEKRDYI